MSARTVVVVLVLALALSMAGATTPAGTDRTAGTTGTAETTGTIGITERAVLDRFEAGYAVFVLDDGRRSAGVGERWTDGRTVVVARAALPPAGRHPDAVFAIERDESGAFDLRYDRAATRARSARSRKRFERLAADEFEGRRSVCRI